MWWLVVGLVVLGWVVLPLPLAVAVGRAFSAAELGEPAEPVEVPVGEAK